MWHNSQCKVIDRFSGAPCSLDFRPSPDQNAFQPICRMQTAFTDACPGMKQCNCRSTLNIPEGAAAASKVLLSPRGTQVRIGPADAPASARPDGTWQHFRVLDRQKQSTPAFCNVGCLLQWTSIARLSIAAVWLRLLMSSRNLQCKAFAEVSGCLQSRHVEIVLLLPPLFNICKGSANQCHGRCNMCHDAGCAAGGLAAVCKEAACR